MGAYEYTALNAKGAEKKGIMEGDSSRQIRQQLREQNLIPLKVEEVAKQTRQHKGKNKLGGGVSIMALALMTRQLATLSRTGTPLADALATVGRQTDKPRMKSLLMALRAQVLEGHTLADAFASFPNVFDNLYVATVRAGEHSGHLDLILERLAEYTENRQQMRQKVQMALLYPVILTVMAILVVGALLAFVVPQVVQVFENTGQALPWLTRALIASSDFLRANFPYLIAFIAFLIYLFRWMMKKEAFRLRMHRLVLHIPVVGTLVQGMNTARMARTLSILSASSVPLLEALHISAQVLTNIPMRQSVEQATIRVREGTSLAQALEQSGYFPPLLIQLISGGEASGELEKMLEHAAISQERELHSIIATLFGLLEPLIIVAMGGVVLIIVLAILLPIFEMNQLVH
ncbi:General secretion pathway protein F [hydrothermal vent metagenome]|uniref:General secretion pathway protein F n=1 Tax=hydrothermal vent metagenome TaxID=652676 RepID=A0A3B1BSP2_9ZZZZ